MIIDLTPQELRQEFKIRYVRRRINDSDLFEFVIQSDIDRKDLKVSTPVIVIRRVGERAGVAKQFEWNSLMNSSNYYIINHSNLSDQELIVTINRIQFPGIIRGEVTNSLNKRIFIDTLTAEYYALKV
jgi:rhodanese-related sulfurtransferase